MSDSRLDLLQSLARKSERRMVLLVLDGVGDLRTAEQPKTALEQAATPHLDALARCSALGRLVPCGSGVTPGSGPGHLALFGYDPTLPEYDIGRGVLEALGLGLALEPTTLAARANFASVDDEGRLTDRRAGRIPTEETVRLCARLRESLDELPADGVTVRVEPGEGYRFVVLFDGPNLSPELADTDPQRLGVEPLRLAAESERAEATVQALQPIVDHFRRVLEDEPQANAFLLRGFSTLPHLRTFDDLYGIRAGCFAGYPLYRGVSSACGMEVLECGKRIGDLLDVVEAEWERFDYLFLHVKQTDQAGEDGDLETKVAVLEEVDAALPRLLDLEPGVLAITGDHSTPAPMRSHSWHPVPLLLAGPHVGIDDTDRFDEMAAIHGGVGTLPARDLMGLMLANAGRLTKFGA